MKTSGYTIATLGSHSALQILRGAKDEGFKTLLITTPKRVDFYNRFAKTKVNLANKRYTFIDEVLEIPSFADFPALEKKLKSKKVIIIPHGSFVAHLGVDKNKKMALPYFGNKAVLDFEEDREKQRDWLQKAGINLPKQFDDPNNMDYPVIVKSYGAAGGKGYFYARNKTDFQKQIKNMGDGKFIIQEYIIGVTFYFAFFYSPLTGQVELMGTDRRYESNVDSLGRIPLHGQQYLNIDPSYVVVGNAPLVLRESMLPEVYDMAQRVIDTSKKLIDKKGLFGPFCLETVITPDQKIYAIEISGRIVAGTNLFINGSPYGWLHYDEPMSSGRRIAREIKLGIEQKKLDELLD